MLPVRCWAPAAAGVLIALHANLARATAFADAVVSYEPGTGHAAGLTNPAAALGGPTAEFDDPWGHSVVDPFTAPYLPEHVVSIGAGGWLTVRLAGPVQDDPGHPFGLDLLIYGTTAFLDADWPNGRTDGGPTLFGHNTGQTRLWVSADGLQFYQLDPLRAPVVDGLFPTDSFGLPGLPVNPGLTAGDFANRTRDEIRTLYAGSAGGTAYDLTWAQDGAGQPVDPGAVRFVRVEVLSGHSEIDAFAVVVPEPAAGWVLGWGLAAGVAALGAKRRKRGAGR